MHIIIEYSYNLWYIIRKEPLMARQNYCRKKLNHFHKYISFKCHIWYNSKSIHNIVDSHSRFHFFSLYLICCLILLGETGLKLPDSYPAFVISFISGLSPGASGLLPGKLCILRRTSLHIFVFPTLGPFVKAEDSLVTSLVGSFFYPR